ncbi:MAG: sensor histidine kinase [Candidatus Sericytochromatia bacterium]|nr:sensor histidine kinase [Candidatus Tanganyikabacteria bacterium]
MARERKPTQFGASLRTRLVLLLVAVLLPVAGLLVQSAIEQRNLATTTVEVGAIRSVRPIAADLDRLVAAARQLLMVVANLPAVRDHRGAEAGRFFARLIGDNPIYANIGATTADGRIFASGLPMPTPIDASERSWFRRAVLTRHFAIGNFQVGRITRKATINVAYPILARGGKVETVVFAAIDLGYLDRVAADLDLPPGSAVVLVDREGTLLARHPRMAGAIGQRLPDEALRRALLVQDQAVLEGTGLDGVRRVWAFAQIGWEPEGPGAFVGVGLPHAAVYRDADARVARNLFILVALFGALIALVWVGADRLALRPVDRLLAATRKLAGGDLQARSGPPYASGEIGALALAFDEMAARLESLRMQREQAVREEREAQAEAAALKEVDHLRRQFVNAVSHELRIPLTSIVGFAEFLEDEIGGPLTEKQSEFVGQIRRSALRLAGIVDDLLDYARIEAGTFALRREAADLRAKVGEIVESMRPQAQEARLALDADLPAEAMVLDMDPHRIGQVLTNLIGNAIKFTPAGGVVKVALRPADGRARVEVADTGPGIAPEDLAKLFKPFSQLEAGRKAGGTGLGLSIAKAFVEGHGGQIGVDSRPGAGSVFWFTLPALDPDRQAEDGVSEMSTASRGLKP